MEAYFVYMTAGNSDEASLIAKTVVQERLAACANLLGDIRSIYWWEGELCEGTEVAIVLKTTHIQKNALVDRIKQLHSYECPCVVCMPIESGNPDFLEWIAKEATTAG